MDPVDEHRDGNLRVVGVDVCLAWATRLQGVLQRRSRLLVWRCLLLLLLLQLPLLLLRLLMHPLLGLKLPQRQRLARGRRRRGLSLQGRGTLH